MNTKLIIETYIAYELCSGEPVYVKEELHPLIDLINKKEIADESKDRFINRSKNDLIKIGVLKEKSRRRLSNDSIETRSKNLSAIATRLGVKENNSLNERISIISLEDCVYNLVPYHTVPKHLQKIYKIAKIMKTERKNEKQETYRDFLDYFFSNGIEQNRKTMAELRDLLGVIRDTISLANELANQKGKKINRTVYNDLISAVISVKYKIGFDPLF